MAYDPDDPFDDDEQEWSEETDLWLAQCANVEMAAHGLQIGDKPLSTTDRNNLLGFLQYWAELNPHELYEVRRSMENPFDGGYGLPQKPVAYAMRLFGWLDEENAEFMWGMGWDAQLDQLEVPDVEEGPPLEPNLRMGGGGGGGGGPPDLMITRRPCDVVVEGMTDQGDKWLKDYELVLDDVEYMPAELAVAAVVFEEDVALSVSIMGPQDWLAYMRKETSPPKL
jgi:hypothetical protein